MSDYKVVAPVAPTTQQPVRLSPIEHAGLGAIGTFGGGILVILALLAFGTIGLAALPVAGGVVFALAGVPFIVLACGSLAHLGLHVYDTLKHRHQYAGYQGAEGGGKEIQLVPVRHWQDEPSYRPAGSETGISKSDLRWLVGHLDLEGQSGWTERTLMDEQMPSGTVVNRDVYDAFIRVLVQHNWLVGRTERFKGRLMLGPAEIGGELGL